MSEQGWREFLESDDVGDWVVLHGGPVAMFRTGSMAESARLAEAIAQVEGVEGSRVALTIAGNGLTVRLTREMWGVETRHIALAREISAVARSYEAVSDRSAVQEVQLAISAQPNDIDLGFWRAVLGYSPMAEDNAIDPLAHGSTVWMQDLDPAKPLRHAMHIDVSLAREEAEKRLAAALAAGGRIVDESNAPGGWILSDRAGNKVCIASWPDGAATPAWASDT